MVFEPLLQAEVFFHPSAAGVQYQAGELQGFPLLQIMIDQLLPLVLVAGRNPGISIPRQIDKVAGSVDPIKIYRLCATRRAAGECQPFLPDEGIDQAGLPYVTSP